MDIKSAFRLLTINPGDFDLLGYYFNNCFYIDKCLPMGCAISCNLFEKFVTFLHWIIEYNSGCNSFDHYLDDFIFMGSSDSNDCSMLMSVFTDLCNEIGVPVASEETVGPLTRLTFPGLEIDSVD
ncbi:hypothetical protein SNE40_022245 [Patella caerulea]|uniref:Reverse transcriptase domain-containing protein n=1 Tax=Patella caerulea TaxID=87958 RepID=A0AAN8GFN6_PATCE